MAAFSLPLRDVPSDRFLVIEIDGRSIGVCRIGDNVVAYENRCPHQFGPACEGILVEWVTEVVDAGGLKVGEEAVPGRIHLVCPWHGVEFDAATGRCVSQPRWQLKPVLVRVEGELVTIEV